MEDEYFLLSGAQEDQAKVWVLAPGEIRASDRPVFRAKASAVVCGAWNHSYKVVAAGGSDGTVLLVSIETGGKLAPFVHGEPVSHLCFSASSRFLASASASTLKLWDLKTRKGAPILEFALASRPRSLAIDRSQSRLVVVVEEGSLFTWEILDGEVGQPFEVSMPSQRFTCASFWLSHDRSLDPFLLLGDDSGAVRVWDLGPPPSRRRSLGATDAAASAASWTPVWDTPASGHHPGQGTSLFLTSANGSGLAKPLDESAPLADPSLFATCAGDGVLNIFSFRERRHLFQFRFATPLRCLDFAPDGFRVVIGDEEGQIQALDVRESSPVAVESAHRGPVLFLAVARAPVRSLSLSILASASAASGGGRVEALSDALSVTSTAPLSSHSLASDAFPTTSPLAQPGSDGSGGAGVRTLVASLPTTSSTPPATSASASASASSTTSVSSSRESRSRTASLTVATDAPSEEPSRTRAAAPLRSPANPPEPPLPASATTLSPLASSALTQPPSLPSSATPAMVRPASAKSASTSSSSGPAPPRTRSPSPAPAPAPLSAPAPSPAPAPVPSSLSTRSATSSSATAVSARPPTASPASRASSSSSSSSSSSPSPQLAPSSTSTSAATTASPPARAPSPATSSTGTRRPSPSVSAYLSSPSAAAAPSPSAVAAVSVDAVAAAVRSAIAPALEGIDNLHLDLLRQLHLQRVEWQRALREQADELARLRDEVRALRDENAALRRVF